MRKKLATRGGLLTLLVAVGIGVSSVVPAAAATIVAPRAANSDEPITLPETKGGIPPAVRAVIQRMIESPIGEKINDLEWNPESGTLDVHVINDDGVALEPTLREAFGDRYRLVQDQYSSKELRNVAYQLANDGVASGIPVASVSPATNNSGLVVTLVENASLKRSVPIDQDALRSKTSVPLEFGTTNTAPQQASGWRWGDATPFWGGSHIYNASNGIACTSAFPVINRQPGFNAVAMLTADHCGGTGEAWRSGQSGGSNWAVGTLQSGNSGGSDIRRLGARTIRGMSTLGTTTTVPTSTSSAPITR